MSFTELLCGGKSVKEKKIVYRLDESWMQGRAVYGGMSAALCFDGAQKLISNLPALRSASINFIGVGGPDVWVEAAILRQGKSVTYVSSRLYGDQGIVCDAVFCFGVARASDLNSNYGLALYGNKVDFPKPLECVSIYSQAQADKSDVTPPILKKPRKPSFINHFDARIVKGDFPFSGSIQPGSELWVRHEDPNATGLLALIGLADMPPPAVLSAMKKPAPVSSMTWMFNLLTNDFSNDDGWWLLGSFAEHAEDGYSSQNMTVHSQMGELVMVGRQNVAVFS